MEGFSLHYFIKLKIFNKKLDKFLKIVYNDGVIKKGDENMNYNTNQEKKYYAVTVPQGHCGTKNSRDITFYFEAFDAYHAMCLARKMPSVKHSHLCSKTREITKEEYLEKRKVSSYHRF